VRNPKVSVVIPNYNYGDYLSDALDSVLSQTFQDFEVIVVDNFSTDNTMEVIEGKRSEKIRVIQFQNNGSIGAARNRGVAEAKGGFVAFLDSDDLWHPSKLAVQFSRTETEADLSFHDLKHFGARNFSAFRGWSLGNYPLQRLASEGNPIATSSVLARKSVLLEAGGFPEATEVVSVEDFALWLRLAHKGASFLYIPLTLGKYRIHGGMTSKSDSPSRAELVLEPYLPQLSEQRVQMARGFIAYARGTRELSLGNANQAKQHFVFALRFGAFRFRWRATLRLLRVKLQRD
jgi:GT2 family glycosyltransferase